MFVRERLSCSCRQEGTDGIKCNQQSSLEAQGVIFFFFLNGSYIIFFNLIFTERNKISINSIPENYSRRQ
jgi:hypothetical protein